MHCKINNDTVWEHVTSSLEAGYTVLLYFIFFENAYLGIHQIELHEP